MQVDNLFKAIERRTEQDLYRMTFRAVATSQVELLQQIEENRKAMKRQRIATEVLWFFAALALGFLLGYIADQSIRALAPGFHERLAGFWFKKATNVLYFLCALMFLGVYIVRATIWALRML